MAEGAAAEFGGDAIGALSALATAGAAGFLIGFEREWTHRMEGRRESFAGARTFALVAFTGALAGLLGEALLGTGSFRAPLFHLRFELVSKREERT